MSGSHTPLLPGFSWVIDGLLAGMAHPDAAWRPLEEVLHTLSDGGVSGIVSLTERPLETKTVTKFGFVYLHIPISDFGVPTFEAIEAVNALVDEAEEEERGIVIHCGAGMGRTGTLLACYLAHQGASAQDAIDRVRTIRPGSIETPGQEDVVMRFAEYERDSSH